MESYTKFLFLFLFFNLILEIYASYIEFTLGNDKLCSIVKTRKLSINKDALTVYNTRTFDHWLGFKEFQCKFKLKVSNHQGIYAVFQKLSFRKDSNGQCIDYVQFKESNDRKSSKLCGNISIFLDREENTNFESSNDDNSLLSYSYRDYQGDLEVLIHVANIKLEPNEILDLKIVFTPFRKSPNDDYRPCVPGEYIKAEYFSDGIVNCPYRCIDEDFCSNEPTHRSEKNNIKVTAGAIGTIIFAFVIFFICIFNMKKHKVFCWAEYPNPNVTTSTRASNNCADEEGESRDHLNALQLTSPSSASPSAPSPQEDKDLPPTYDSLFPNR